jgi:putative oxidoreductase
MLSSLHRHSDWGLLVLRLVIGAIFLYHGMMKWQMSDLSPIMTILKYAEPLGGLALVLGALTQLAALGLAIIMLGAIYMKASGFGQQALDFAGSFAPQGGTGWEFDLIILAGCVMLLIMGAGSMSLDALVMKKK